MRLQLHSRPAAVTRASTATNDTDGDFFISHHNNWHQHCDDDGGCCCCLPHHYHKNNKNKHTTGALRRDLINERTVLTASTAVAKSAFRSTSLNRYVTFLQTGFRDSERSDRFRRVHPSQANATGVFWSEVHGTSWIRANSSKSEKPSAEERRYHQ